VNKIFIHELVIPAMIGVYPEERLQKQALVFDIELVTDLSRSAKSDHIDDTVNYADVCKALQRYVQHTQFQLLEALASDVCVWLKSTFPVSQCVVKITKKPADLTNVAGVAVEFSV